MSSIRAPSAPCWTTPDPVAAGITAAAREAQALLRIPGIAGVNISGLASARGYKFAAQVKAELAQRIRDSSAVMTGDIVDPMAAEFGTVAEWTAQVAAEPGPGILHSGGLPGQRSSLGPGLAAGRAGATAR